MARKSDNNGTAGTSAVVHREPPPGVVVRPSDLGPPEAVETHTPMQRLRSALRLSNDTPDQTVIVEAAMRIERGEFPPDKERP